MDENAKTSQRRPWVRTLGILVVGGVIGVLFWGAFNWTVELTNTETFCISCHEMKENVYQEYTETIHYYNRSGVRAVCTDCHVPKEWIYKIRRKIQASNELYHKIIGSIDTREKFQAKRLELASHVWETMKTTDSRECRNCHDDESMDFGVQESRSADRHEEGFDEGKTCIDCHRGIAHQLPEGANEAYDEIAKRVEAKSGN
ncbi:MAG: NapC/NirT family cytochrome c [Hyphomicrobiales bacterium]|nr:NapC/NirT family cytochrome c [Hyphomicrobiales bacterium]